MPFLLYIAAGFGGITAAGLYYLYSKTQHQKSISPDELTQWINDSYGDESANADADLPPEKPAVLLLNDEVKEWLCEDNVFDPDVIEVENLPGGLEGMGIVLSNVFSRRECQQIIQETEKLGYGSLGRSKTGGAYRGNSRLQCIDAGGSFTEALWKRIIPYIPTKESIPGEPLWVASGLNDHYRFARYRKGQGFAKHVDKQTILEHERCSILTVNIYLNDIAPELRGRTRFYAKPGGLGKPVAETGGVAGSVAIFKQTAVDYSPWHDGDKLLGGLKYLMRTDVMYTKGE